MPADYEKPVYKSNKDKYRDAVKNDKPRQRPADSDHTKMPPRPKPKPR